MLDQINFNFSFSGLKTATKNLVDSNVYDIPSICCEFENAVCDVLITKTMRAIKKYNAKSLLLGGGVSANNQLRTRFTNDCVSENLTLFIPPISLCGDNAAYIAGAAFFMKDLQQMPINASPSLGIMDLF